MAQSADPRISPDEENIKKRFFMLSKLFELFSEGLEKVHSDSVYLNLELLHCAVVAYFDDIEKYKAYAGSQYANEYKQAAFTIKWISRFRPIQIKESANTTGVLVTVNAAFALFCGFTFMSPAVAASITPEFYDKLIYNLTYRNILGKEWAMIMELMDKLATSSKKH